MVPLIQIAGPKNDVLYFIEQSAHIFCQRKFGKILSAYYTWKVVAASVTR